MSAELVQHTDIYWVAYAARMCSGTLDKMDSQAPQQHFWDQGRLGPKDRALIEKRILQKDQKYDPLFPAHESVLEHAVYTFHVAFSRTCLQELARHRIASPSVESTRWALKRILKHVDSDTLREYVDRYMTRTGDEEVDEANLQQIAKVAGWSNAPKEIRKKNDVIKYAIPEAFKTQLLFTINARSLRNMFRLRTSHRALWEIRDTAFEMVEVIPEDHKFLFSDRIHERPK
jgi:thymidylate synthase (FAD)